VFSKKKSQLGRSQERFERNDRKTQQVSREELRQEEPSNVTNIERYREEGFGVRQMDVNGQVGNVRYWRMVSDRI
jgi:acyl-ACP thioesterase